MVGLFATMRLDKREARLKLTQRALLAAGEQGCTVPCHYRGAELGRFACKPGVHISKKTS